MPITVTIKARRVKLNKETKLLIGYYQKALKNNSLRVETTESGPRTPAATDGVVARKGFYARWVLSSLEKISDEALGANALDLPCFQVELDAPAELLLNSYLEFLNSMLLAQKLGPDDTEQPEISSKFVLIRELLYRLVSIALSSSLDLQQDGDILVKALKEFLGSVRDNENLIDFGVLNLAQGKVSPFLELLSIEHAKWVTQIEQMVRMVKAIHGHQKTISDLLTSLRKTDKTISAHLVTYLKPDNVISSFSNEWIMTALHTIEKSLSLENKPANQNNRQKLRENQTAIVLKTDQADHPLTQSQKLITTNLFIKLKNDNDSAAELCAMHVQKLYELANYSRVVYDIFAHIDMLLTCTSWVPIITGIIDFKELSRLLTHYSMQCAEVLSIPEELRKRILSNQAGRGLIKYEMASGEGLAQIMLDQAIDLGVLSNEGLRQRMATMIGTTLAALTQLQTKLGVAYQIVDIKRLEKFNLIEATELVGEIKSLPQLNKQLLIKNDQVATLKNETSILRKEAKQVEEKATEIAKREKEIQVREFKLLQNNAAPLDVRLLMTQTLHKLLMNDALTHPTLEILLVQGADLVLQGKEGKYSGCTALHIAAAQGNKDYCEWLLAKKVPVNIEASNGDTPFDKAIEAEFTIVANYLKAQEGMTGHVQQFTNQLHAFLNADDLTEEDDSVRKYMDLLNKLLIRGAEPNGVSTLPNGCHGDTPLHTLLIKGNKHLIGWFIGMGANPQALSHPQKETPYAKLCRIIDTTFNQEKKKEMIETLKFIKERYPEFLPSASNAHTQASSPNQYGQNRFFLDKEAVERQQKQKEKTGEGEEFKISSPKK